MKKYDNFCSALRNLKDIYEYEEPYNQEIALDIVSQTKEKYYQMFCELKKEIDKNWL